MHIYDLNYKDIQNLQEKLEIPKSELSAKRVFHKIYRKLELPIKYHPQISDKLVDHLNSLEQTTLKIKSFHEAKDSTVKFIHELQDGLTIETVLIPFRKTYTLCVSSQVGCAMNCSFCFTAKQGLHRNLMSHEITGQLTSVRNWILKKNKEANPITNIVFMGQGEPLHNLDEVVKSINILSDPFGLSVSRKKITLSTSGYISSKIDLNNIKDINLAISLHSAIDLKRSSIIPINKAYPTSLIKKTINSWGKLVEIEYLLIQNFNMAQDDIEALINFTKDIKCVVNLIPFNEFPDSKFKRPTDNEINSFKKILVQNNLRVMVRKTKGDEILAACGQLNTNIS